MFEDVKLVIWGIFDEIEDLDHTDHLKKLIYDKMRRLPKISNTLMGYEWYFWQDWICLVDKIVQ